MGKHNKKKSTFFSDFKAFITKGNIMDMAVGVVIGGAFSAIVNSLVNDIIMPLLTLATGDGVQGLSIVLNGKEKYLADGSVNPEAVLWNYGNFLQTIINFLIIALCIFTTLRIIMNIKKKSEELAEKAKQKALSNGDTQQANDEQTVAQEAVADVAEEVKADDSTVAQTVEETNVEEKVATTQDAQEETQEDILKQIRDLLATMQSQKSEKTTSSKTVTKTAVKKTAKSEK